MAFRVILSRFMPVGHSQYTGGGVPRHIQKGGGS